jgi:phosphotransferase system  glucose/maltose/N-acetylglucosamine-specific IIC component
MPADADDSIDTLLRLSFEGAVEDGGFTDRVVRTLPRRRPQGAWFSLVGMLAGAVSCWLAMRSSPIVLSGWKNWVSEDPSVPLTPLLISVLGLSLLGLIWAISESVEDGRNVLAHPE